MRIPPLNVVFSKVNKILDDFATSSKLWNDFLQARNLIMPSISIVFHRYKQKDKITGLTSGGLFLFFQDQIELCQARGGGSKRTFGSPKTQGNQNQNLGKFKLFNENEPGLENNI